MVVVPPRLNKDRDQAGNDFGSGIHGKQRMIRNGMIRNGNEMKMRNVDKLMPIHLQRWKIPQQKRGNVKLLLSQPVRDCSQGDTYFDLIIELARLRSALFLFSVVTFHVGTTSVMFVMQSTPVYLLISSTTIFKLTIA